MSAASPEPDEGDRPARRDAYATFRPVRGAWVARIMAIISVLVFTLVAIFSPGYEGVTPAVTVLNRVAIFGLGVLIGAFLWRYAVIRAVPTERGLTVVNLFRTYELEWAQILDVGFSGGTAWAMLELTDTEQLAVMAIQRADGEGAHKEASRLAALIQHHQNLTSEGPPRRPEDGRDNGAGEGKDDGAGDGPDPNPA